MKKFNRIIKSVISLAMSFVFIFGIGCKSEEGGAGGAVIKPKPPVEKTITLKQTSYDMTVGSTVSLEIEKYDAESANPITWTSSNNSIAKVKQTDISTIVEVEAMGEGDATITVSQGTATATCAISTSFGESSAEVVLSVADEFNIQANNEFNLNPKIKFNGKTYDDGEFTYSCSDETNFSIENGVLVGTTSGVSTDVTIKGAWRGKDSDDMRLLEKTVTVNVIDSVSLVLEGLYGETMQIYTTAEFAGKTYVNEMDFKPVVYINDSAEPKQDADITTEMSGDSVEYDATTGTVIGKHTGITIFTVTYNDNGVALSKTFKVEVLRPTDRLAAKIKYFSAYSGTLRDPDDNFKEKTLGEYLYPNDADVEIIDAFMGETELTVDDNGKVFGVAYESANTCDQTITIGTKTSMYIIDMTVYGQYVYEAKDLSVFTRNQAHISYDGYVELGKDIDASNFTMGIHFEGKKSSNLPSGNAYAGDAYYSGVFDGKGYAINNVTATPMTGIGSPTGGIHGIFCALKGATIKNVAFTNIEATGRIFLAYFSKDTNYENVYFSVNSLNTTKWHNNTANFLTYLPLTGGNFNNIFISISEDVAIDLTNLSASKLYIMSSFATVSRSEVVPEFNNCVIVSKLPVGYSAHVLGQFAVAFGQNETDTRISTVTTHMWTRLTKLGSSLRNSLKKDYYKLEGADQTKDDGEIIILMGRAQVLKGVYRFDTVADLKADANISKVLAKFPSEYWTVNNGELVWGASQSAE